MIRAEKNIEVMTQRRQHPAVTMMQQNAPVLGNHLIH